MEEATLTEAGRSLLVRKCGRAMRAAARRTASWVDAALVAVRELLKAWVNEVFHLGSSLATAFTVLVMLAFHRPGTSHAC